MRRLLLLIALLLGCPPVDETEPLNLPEDPAAWGVPVGVRSAESNGVALEIWYPAPDAVADEPTEDLDLIALLPAEFTERVGELDVPMIPQRAVRDAPLRVTGELFPVVVFSHGFGGWRSQSVDHAAHLASRGYVVVAADHVGRRFQDLVPCLFDPPLAGCNVFADDDPGPPGIWEAAGWVSGGGDGFLSGAVDASRMGLSGHSAGGGSISSVANLDDRFDAVLALASPPRVETDVPTLSIEGACDGILLAEDVREADALVTNGELVEIATAGHLAFTDICLADVGSIAVDVLAPRDDVNHTFLDQLTQLATDGCPGWTPTVDGCTEFGDLETAQRIVRHYSAAFFDEALKGEGAGVEAGLFDGVEVVP